ncbi:MAG: NAD-dependent epimerase/dehydratase family protein, partial [Acidimicrobiales bacterium]
VDALIERNHEVVVVDRADPAYRNEHATYVQGDVRDRDTCLKVTRGVQAVSHQAARVGLGTDFGDVADYVSDNDLGTASLLWALNEAGFAGRLVLASSMVVYGEGGFRCRGCGPVRPGPRTAERLAAGLFEPPCPACGSDLSPTAVTEDAVGDPRNVYAATKLHQEHLCFTYARESPSSVVALRYHNVYGPRAPLDTPYAGVASILLGAVLKREAPRVFEDGRQLRDFIHVRDVAQANVAALTTPEALAGPYNVASGEPRSVHDLARALWSSVGESGPEPVITADWRLGDVRHVFASPHKAASEMGFRAETSFHQGMNELARSGAGSWAGSGPGPV